jgi:DNA-binding MarR family transcriptional regulator
MENTIVEKTVNELFELVYVAMDFEGTPKKYGTDVQISSSEIFQIKCVHDLSKANITILAKELGISKSAVSQSIKKIKAKGLVSIDIDQENNSRYVINLTQKGQVAHREHMLLRNEINERVKESLKNHTDKSCEEINEFLKISKKILKNFV